MIAYIEPRGFVQLLHIDEEEAAIIADKAPGTILFFLSTNISEAEFLGIWEYIPPDDFFDEVVEHCDGAGNVFLRIGRYYNIDMNREVSVVLPLVKEKS